MTKKAIKKAYDLLVEKNWNMEFWETRKVTAFESFEYSVKKALEDGKGALHLYDLIEWLFIRGTEEEVQDLKDVFKDYLK